MKNIKLRIVYLILCSALLLFALFMLAVNLIIPAHFVREAKKALLNEAEYQNRAIPYTYDEPTYDEGEEGNFFTPSIVFLEMENSYQPNTWNRDTYRLEKELLEYCAGRDLSLNQCYTFKTDRHHLIFMSVQEDYGDGEESYSYIMYIDIGQMCIRDSQDPRQVHRQPGGKLRPRAERLLLRCGGGLAVFHDLAACRVSAAG